jgi:hypothetical protein
MKTVALTVMLAIVGSPDPGVAQTRAKLPPRAVTSTSGCSSTEADLRSMAMDLLAKSSDEQDFFRALDSAVGVPPNRDFPGSATIGYRDGLSVNVLFPYGGYRMGLKDAIRKRDPLAAVLLVSSVMVMVTPGMIDAPDIIKVIVERDGVEVAPLSSTLTPTMMQTRTGAKEMIHSGILFYPCLAFAPGATVVVTAIPRQGDNLIKRFTAGELAQLK